MKRFMFLTDTHYRLDKPKGRTDDIWTSQQAELSDIGTLAHEHSVDAILHGGDFFDRHNPPHKLVADIIEWCKYVGVPIYSIIGNHDITGYNLDSVRNSGLGVLFESGAVERLEEEVFEEDKIIIRSAHSTLAMENDYFFTEKKYETYLKIIITHNYIIPAETMPFEFKHPDSIKTNADLVLVGHYHTPFDYQGAHTRWVNPGAIARWSTDQKDRQPTVLMIDVEDGKYKIEKVPIESAHNAEDIFDIEQIAVEKNREQDIESFVRELESTTFAAVDIEQEVKRVGEAQGIPALIIEKVLGKIREAKETLK